ncbi:MULTISPECIES: fimbria/pilus outer membrane usher protein [Pseudomonas]|uniref:fimbria/pilus outer membrane usher protein n=1 Tax=Pseudomonas TaxID=286 RepID=UPI0006ACF159|nr:MULTISPECIES: fimbria/pilus outer membrane usher protein [Pseudomonas]MDI3372133.1 fimbria/pilus outer membrane usher protein [Pseudomonas sp. V104_10]NBB07003.1 fimbria/pilus outer membrane usher protein [Pseudomonas monteilii]SMC66126.1 outer membrane usher protein [Pseudomonas sp. URIL14HWK12:I5]
MPKLHWRRPVSSRPRPARFALLGSPLILLLVTPALATPSAPRFQAEFMRQAPGLASDAGALALQALAEQEPLAAGRYRVQLLVNHTPLDAREVDIRNNDGQGLQACLTGNLLRDLGLREQALEAPLPSDDRCLDLAALLPHAYADFDPSNLRLSVSIPQIALHRQPSDTIAESRWDAGINAAFINYQASTQHYQSHNGRNRNSHDLYLNSGINIAGWRLRSNQALRDNADGQTDWSRSDTYAQRDIPGLRANLTLGETFTGGEVFRSVPFIGAQVASDLDMHSDTEQQYAPVIRGVAQTRAKLEVLHNGYPIYSTYVAPGPYVIDDLNVGAGHGELEVILTEADGQVRRFTQPYSSLANLLREGVWRYSATVGRYNGAEDLERPVFWQATLARGGIWDSTLYGGAFASDYYHAGALGVARDFAGLGALSLDATQARTDLGGLAGQVQGHSFAMRYGKSFQTGTNLRFAGYRYSTEGYRDFDEAVKDRNQSDRYVGNRRSRLEASIYQNVGNSSVSLTLSQDDYWNRSGQRRNYQVQYNTRWGDLGINLFASQALAERGGDSRLIGLSLSLPLDFGHRHNTTFDLQHQDGRNSQRASLNGGLMNNRLGYQVSLSHDEQQRSSGALSLAYQGTNASYGAGYTEGADYRSVSLNTSGALLAHSSGIVLGPYLSDTSALVHVPDAAGITLENAPASQANKGGYLLAPNLRPYRLNPLILRTDDLPPELIIDNAVQRVAPRRGAIVMATFPSRQVMRLVLTLQLPDGRPLPFGTQLTDAQGQAVAVVGQAGQALVATEHQGEQRLQARWLDQGTRECQVMLTPENITAVNGYRIQTLACHPREAGTPSETSTNQEAAS